MLGVMRAQAYTDLMALLNKAFGKELTKSSKTNNAYAQRGLGS